MDVAMTWLGPLNSGFRLILADAGQGPRYYRKFPADTAQFSAIHTFNR